MRRIFFVVFVLYVASLNTMFSCKPPTPPPLDTIPNDTDTIDTLRNYTKVDAFTSASKYLKIDSILVYSDSAIVYWWDYYNNGDVHLIKWGTTKEVYTDSIDLLPFVEKTRVQTVIKPLTPETHYYAEFFRVYNRGKPVRTMFEFTTPKRK
ncbi:MAG: hypothetical protein N2053_05335 [Chitinispirillaceae bacterium]|nr:hypothetical protein [Chitinispirillaceae bacterium]